MTPVRPRLGVSACLLGQAVRHDGAHKRDRYLVEELAAQVELIAVCPEVEVGMGVPREPVHLVEGPGGRIRLVGVSSGADHTDAMERWAAARAEQLAAADLDGYVFKRGSPSCGIEGVPLHRVRGDCAAVAGETAGLFAAALRRRLPALPVAEEGWLADPGRRDRFVAALFERARRRGES